MAEAQPSAKRCSVCGDEKALDAFYACKAGLRGRHSYCKVCHAARWSKSAGYLSPSDRRERAERAERKAARRKVCKKCGTSKLLSEFKTLPCGSLNKRCLACMKPKVPKQSRDESLARQRERARSRTPESRRAYRARVAAAHGKVFYSRALMADERAEQKKAVLWGVAWRAWLRYIASQLPEEERKRRAREKFKRHYEKRRVYEIERSKYGKRKYYASYKRAGLTVDAVMAIRDAAESCCYCGRPFSQGLKRHLDHVLPLRMGGESIPSNLVAACHECNTSKGAKPLLAWLQGQPEHVRSRAFETLALIE